MHFILITIFVKKSSVLFDKVIFKMSRKELTIEERKIIIHNHELGKSYSEIAIITKKKQINHTKNYKSL